MRRAPHKARKPKPSRLPQPVKQLLQGVALALLLATLGWLLSPNALRLQYLREIGLADVIERHAGQALILAGPAFEYELIRFPPRPVPSGGAPGGPAAQPPPLALASVPAAPPARPEPGRTEQDGDQPCVARPIFNPSRKQQHSIYRWTDANGNLVFSDRGQGDRAEIVGQTAQRGVGMFSADYRFLGDDPDPAFKMALSANVNGVFQFLAKSLELGDVEPLHVRLTIVEGEERFVRYRNAQTQNLATTSGFYSFFTNEAVVRWMGPETSMAVARHEITHLALGNWLGDVPLWLNEGLAEFVERLTFRQYYAASPAPIGRIDEVRRHLQAGRFPSLQRFLKMDRRDWSEIGDDVAYSYAWSLVHYLMQRPGGRALVADHLKALADNRCRRFDRIGHLATTYPGGLAQLSADWAAWVEHGQTLPLSF